MNPYSTMKIGWHQDRLESLRKRERVVPIEIQLILSDLCNQDCSWCAYRAETGLSSENFGERRDDGTINHNPNRMIPAGKAEEILRDAADLGVQSIIFTGGGEPTVHPDHIRLFSLAASLGLRTALNTNGVLLREGWEAAFAPMSYVRVSVDAGSDEDYAATRRVAPGVYGKVLRNIERMAVVFESSGTTLGTGFVVSPDTYPNVVAGVQRLKDAGAAYVRLAYMQTTLGDAAYPGDTLERAREQVEAAKAIADDGFQVFDVMELNRGAPYLRPECWFQEVVTYIGADLNVYRCCYKAYTDIGNVGSLAAQSFRQWLDTAAGVHRSFDARACGRCQLAEKNDVLDYLVGQPPIHVEFV